MKYLVYAESEASQLRYDTLKTFPPSFTANIDMNPLRLHSELQNAKRPRPSGFSVPPNVHSQLRTFSAERLQTA